MKHPSSAVIDQRLFSTKQQHMPAPCRMDITAKSYCGVGHLSPGFPTASGWKAGETEAYYCYWYPLATHPFCDLIIPLYVEAENAPVLKS